MRLLIFSTVTALFVAAVPVLEAQTPAGAPDMRGVPGMPPGGHPAAGPHSALDNTAAFLLSRTGELALTDAQVTRLAAIARRSEARRDAMRDAVRDAMRARMDSIVPRGRAPAGDSAGRDDVRQRMREQGERMRPEMERQREQARAERRDAITVLTAEQQALAWELVAAPADGRGPHDGPRRDGFGPPGGEERAARPGPGAARRPPADDR